MALASTIPFFGAGYYWLKSKCGFLCKHPRDVAHECESDPENEEEAIS